MFTCRSGSQMSFHAKFINAPNTLVIGTVDTDILGITLCNMPKLFQGLKAWLEVGLTWNNLLCYINANEITKVLHSDLLCFTWLSCFHWVQFYCIV